MSTTVGGSMRSRVPITLAAGCLAALASLTACGNGDGTTSEKPATQSTTTKTESSTPAETAMLPDMVGKGLQVAQDQAQEAGFYQLTSHDALGRGRGQFDDRNWQVCFQTPEPGEHPTDTEVDFATVKLEDTCPATDQGTQTETAGTVMPDFKGKSVKVAREALVPNASILVKDASGQGRVILVESNWKVCSQEPAAGTKLEGQPVTLNAVKFGESC